MKNQLLHICCKVVFVAATLLPLPAFNQDIPARNPVIWADVPDLSMIRVGESYYMSSTTMHMSPGVPVMKSDDLVNWKIITYAYDTLADTDALNLQNGMNAYGRGSWASCLRYESGTYYLSTFSSTTNRTYIFTTKDIENGPWTRHSFHPSYHDHTLFFDEDGKIYFIWGAGELHIAELKEDLTGLVPGSEKVLIKNASQPAGEDIMLQAEGSQLFKVNGRYYLFNIVWPQDGMRTVLVHRADNIMGPYEGRVMLEDRGIAQGGIIDTPSGEWYAYLFRDFGSVGRIPYIAPVTWTNDWPEIGINSKVPDELPLPGSKGIMPGIVSSDEFEEEELKLTWQWNHNPDNSSWSLTDGQLRLYNNIISTGFLQARNTLTQRTFGPTSTAEVSLNVRNLKNGDIAGLGLLQANFGYVGVQSDGDSNTLVSVKGKDAKEVVESSIALEQDIIHLKASLDFVNMKDVASFYYSLDGVDWLPIGSPLEMSYTLPHFMGYRFALFSFPKEQTGGIADFDYFRVK